MKRIILAFPMNGAAAKNVSMHLPLSCLYAATLVHKEYDVVIFDGRLKSNQEFENLITDNTVLVGISAITGIQITYGLELSKIAKNKNLPVVWGGTHASLFPEQTLQNNYIDYVIKGEGEIALLNLARHLELGLKLDSKIIEVSIDDFGALPDVPYHLVDVEEYIGSIQNKADRQLPFMFSRGCPYVCGYCSSGYLTKKWKHDNIDRSIQRLEKILYDYQVNYIEFFDENLTTDINILNEFVSKLPDFKWKMQARLDAIPKLDLDFFIEKGLDMISSGLESGSPAMLKLMKKGEKLEGYIKNNKMLSNFDVKARYSFMMGFPTESYNDVMSTVDLALKMVNDNKNVINYPFYVYQAYPGTPLATKFNVKGCDKLEDWAEFGRHNFDTPFIGDNKDLFEKLTFSSKYTGRTFSNMFPNDEEILQLKDKLTYYWEKHDFKNQEWNTMYKKHLDIIHKHFGENAF